jgi:hypothetical protein
MGFIFDFLDFLLGTGKSLNEVVFINKVDKENNVQMKQLTDLLDKVGDNDKEKIENEIRKLKIGIEGEKKIEFELTSIHDTPLICLNDIRLEYNNEVAQMDFILVARSSIIVIESKELIGNISIDNEGNFTRTYQTYQNKIYKKEGMYSPIAQNDRHIEILKRMLVENKVIGKDFPIHSLVVIANDKCIVDKKFAPKAIKELITKYDQLRFKIQDILKSDEIYDINDKDMKYIADYIYEKNKHIEYDYINKLGLKLKEEKPEIIVDNTNISEVGNDDLYEELKKYRYEKAKEKNMLNKVGFIFSNEVLEELILKSPRTKEQFINIKGLGESKWEEYGEDIIKIISKYSNIDEALLSELKKYRYNIAKELNMLNKQGFILTNATLEQIASNKPKTIEELSKIEGMTESKITKYGKDILDIISK